MAFEANLPIASGVICLDINERLDSSDKLMFCKKISGVH